VNILSYVLFAIALVSLWAIWWFTPPRFASRRTELSPDQNATVEDAYRKSIAQGIAGLAFIITLFFTSAQYHLAREAERADRYQKQFDALKGSDVPPHIGGVFGLQQLAEDAPEWRVPILKALSAAAVSFSASGVANGRGRADALAAFVAVALATAPESLTPPAVGRPAAPASAQSGDCFDKGYPNAQAIQAQSVGYDLAGGQFMGAKIVRAHLEDADLTGTDLSGANAYQGHFNDANLALAKLDAANLGCADFRGARLVGAHLDHGSGIATSDMVSGAKIGVQASGAIFESANLTGAHFNYANLQGTDFRRSNMRATQLRFACMDGSTKLRGVNMNSAIFEHAWLTDVDFGPAENLTVGAHLTAERRQQLVQTSGVTVLTGANFDNANLQRTKFTFASLQKATFKDANLREADFRGSDASVDALNQGHTCRTIYPDGTIHGVCGIEWKYADLDVRTCENQFNQIGDNWLPRSPQG